MTDLHMPQPPYLSFEVDQMLRHFLTDDTTIAEDAAGKIRATTLYQQYLEWGKAPTISQTQFGRALTRRGIRAAKSNGIVYRIGVRLR